MVSKQDWINYGIYGANFFSGVNPILALIGAGTKAYEDIFDKNYDRNSHYVDLPRLGLGFLSGLSAVGSASGIFSSYGIDDSLINLLNTVGDASMAFALVTDTKYFKEKSLTGIKEDVSKVKSDLERVF
ncbi:MAG TPA: hypothetical protein VJZ93_02440 [Candidatus Nanoarchaeia archaeon]|nr:hypothetical protein [Candidatus Nanoarchaeia archaeon]